MTSDLTLGETMLGTTDGVTEIGVRHRNGERIYEARRAGLAARLADTVGPQRSEDLVKAWEEEAERRGLARDGDGFWQQGEAWLRGRGSRD